MFRPLLVAVLVPAAGLLAHPDIEEALTRLNGQIVAHPNDATLYIERGELYARHEDWLMAEANYARAAELAPANVRLARSRAALEIAVGRPADALAPLDAVIQADPRDAEALVLRARIRALLGQSPEAVADFTNALALIPTPPPKLFLERAALLPPAEALRSLDSAMAQIGPALPLALRAVALEEAQGLVDAAVARLERIAAQSERKEGWLKQQGDVLLRAGRRHEAHLAYAAALAAIAALPGWLQESPATLEMTAQLRRLAAQS